MGRNEVVDVESVVSFVVTVEKEVEVYHKSDTGYREEEKDIPVVSII